jgi:hypothetical protein
MSHQLCDAVFCDVFYFQRILSRLVTCHESGEICLWDAGRPFLEHTLCTSGSAAALAVIKESPPFHTAGQQFAFFHNDRQRFLVRVHKGFQVQLVDLKTVRR